MWGVVFFVLLLFWFLYSLYLVLCRDSDLNICFFSLFFPFFCLLNGISPSSFFVVCRGQSRSVVTSNKPSRTMVGGVIPHPLVLSLVETSAGHHIEYFLMHYDLASFIFSAKTQNNIKNFSLCNWKKKSVLKGTSLCMDNSASPNTF